MLNQDDDDGGGQLRDESLDDADVDLGDGSVGETWELKLVTRVLGVVRYAGTHR